MAELGDWIDGLRSGDADRAEAAVGALAAAAPADSLPALKALLQDRVDDTRWWAARALAEVDDPMAGDLLARALVDQDAAVRQCAALGLRQHPHPAAIPALIAMLNAPDALSARLAADALIAAGESAVEALIEVLSNQRGAAQVEAARALALIGDTRAIGPLFQVLDSGSAMVEYWASEGLDRMGLGMRFYSPVS